MTSWVCYGANDCSYRDRNMKVVDIFTRFVRQKTGGTDDFGEEKNRLSARPELRHF